MSSDKNSLKSSLVDFFSRCFPKILVVAVVVAACVVFPASSQSSSFRNRNGITEMDSGISNVTIPNLDINITQPKTGEQVAFSVQLLLLLTVLTLAPSILILTTCFLRFSIVLDFIKRALSLQQVPPTAVLNGIALFMTIFVMWPVLSQIYSKSVKPLSDGQISVEQAYKEAEAPLRIFMYNQMSGKNGGTYIATFMKMAKLPQPKNLSEVPTYVIIPAYILHELTVAFKIGVFLYIPFIVIDMVVASVLMSMGMMMLPPVQISMPFKLMLFVLVDGWGLLTQQLFASVAL
ncbi:MAG: flagellar type III secretion system pore protein FliP [Treponema sp.]|nr:flagellar type III secretion system pore protein FliP [Treponema sp.]MBR4631506.1 flagellar type III secretion system pore protein FliP [Treponema sp.]